MIGLSAPAATIRTPWKSRPAVARRASPASRVRCSWPSRPRGRGTSTWTTRYTATTRRARSSAACRTPRARSAPSPWGRTEAVAAGPASAAISARAASSSPGSTSMCHTGCVAIAARR
jgi:hypothetical protein